MESMCAYKKVFLVFLYFVKCHFAFSNDLDSTKSIKNKKLVLKVGIPAVYLSLSTGLYYSWYKQYNTGKFHLFNDANEWLQMDKVGHATSNYWGQKESYNWFKWAGFSQKKSIILSGALALGFMTSIEVMDGFSKGWGFSTTDMAANISGVALFSVQEYFFQREYFQLKYSYHKSNLTSIRPSILGSNIPENIIKDYNGQTYWLDINLQLISKKLPPYLCFSLGYGANGMLGARNNLFESNKNYYDFSYIPRYRQWYFSFDLDLNEIHTKKKWINKIIHTFAFIKVPFPSLELNKKQGLVFKPLYF